MTTKQPTKRTGTQNNSLHLWFEWVATELNLAGYTVQMVLKEKIDLDWTAEMVKELLWRSAQKAILGKQSTTELNKIEDIDKVLEHLNRHLGEKFGIHVPFPVDGQKSIRESQDTHY
jgi:hypothetical protein